MEYGGAVLGLWCGAAERMIASAILLLLPGPLSPPVENDKDQAAQGEDGDGRDRRGGDHHGARHCGKSFAFSPGVQPKSDKGACGRLLIRPIAGNF